VARRAVIAVAGSAAVLGGSGLAAVVAPRLAGGEAATARAAEPPKRLTLAWAGDTTLGSRYGLPAHHGWQVLRRAAPALRAADLTALNYEGTLATTGSSKCGASPGPTCFAFRAPPRNAAALRRAGVDLANLANNHAFDYGAVAMGQTVRALHRRGIGVTGRPGEVWRATVRGVRVAALGFASYAWSNPIADLGVTRARVRAAARGADVVLVFLHGGAEGADRVRVPRGTETYLGEDRGNLRGFAHAAVDAGADLVLGSGPHVLRGIERYHGRLIAYSLGNLGGFHNFGTGGLSAFSAVLRVTVTGGGRFVEGAITSLRLDRAGIPHVDRRRRAEQLIAALSRDDFGRRGIVIADRAETEPGSLVAGPP
jgi:poly-gamma-glutamate capsule biosynthesis protein CapA/YwtB (metallophosphatase superfamily)